MSTIHICDRCKKEFPQRKELWQVEFQNPDGSGIEDTLYDMCDSCIDALRHWMRNFSSRIENRG